MKKFIDTNIFLRYVDGNEDVVNFWKKLVVGKQKYWVQTVVVSELVWVMSSLYKFDRLKISDFLMSMIRTNNLIWTSECDLERALHWYRLGIAKYNDCLIASAMKNNDQIISFDREFNRFEEIKRIEPKDLIG
jgi:predicted nucleic acid-binding protein